MTDETTAPSSAGERVAQFWSANPVNFPDAISVEESLDHFAWRNQQYLGELEVMSVEGADGKVVLDYGCGPGNDLVGFGHYSKPARLIGMDVAERALFLARNRLAVHGIHAELMLQTPQSDRIPLENGSVDLVHSSGVLHHTTDPAAILSEFRRVLRPDGYAQIMVYHYDSIWMHLYVAFVKMLVEGRYAGLSKREAFRHTTDTENCPISRCYTFAQFAELAASAGLRCELAGVSVSTTEMKVLPQRFDALEDQRLDRESRGFLYEVTFNERGLPVHRGRVAGIDLMCRLYPD